MNTIHLVTNDVDHEGSTPVAAFESVTAAYNFAEKMDDADVVIDSVTVLELPFYSVDDPAPQLKRFYIADFYVPLIGAPPAGEIIFFESDVRIANSTNDAMITTDTVRNVRAEGYDPVAVMNIGLERWTQRRKELKDG